MRKQIVAGNWKMNTLINEGEDLVLAILEHMSEVKDTVVIVAPPFTHLDRISKIVKGTALHLSAQNCAEKDSGAYTGEVSAKMLVSVGVQYCIIGHSERREYYHETNDIVCTKLQEALRNNLIPILCVGEVLAEREANRHFDVVKEQLESTVCLLNESDFEKVIIAYEPVWAIGTGKTATPAQAQEMHHFIRQVLREKFGIKADNTSILYGGSCKPSNAEEIFAQPDVDGGLIGGASLVAEDFIKIAKSF